LLIYHYIWNFSIYRKHNSFFYSYKLWGKHKPSCVVESKQRSSLNDYISIATSPSDPFAKGATITKQVVCTPGMKLTVTKDKKYFCDGQFIGKQR